MPNRLADELSPYLLQHADNPVDWYPWCDEALERAVELDRPIFLSIGYSACHWCHVMEHESFEDETIAEVLNDNFVSIKVDREQRPDLDQLYMNAVMALRQGQGGWPLSVFLTPSREVFFGGTYWPPRSRMGMPGFDRVLHSVLDAWTNRRDQVVQQSQQITAWLNADEADSNSDVSKVQIQQWLQDAAAALQRAFDPVHGGFGSAPKFPHAMDLSLLIRLSQNWPVHQSPGSSEMVNMVAVSLKKMAYGGIFDHLAGGFARYSVDDYWLVPHFEKMLYDNALLAGVYLEMYESVGDEFYAMIARKTLDYLLNEMRDPSGGFHSTEDADSEGVEGKFYVWTRSEVLNLLGAETGERFCDLYGVTDAGNFEGANILHMRKSYQQFADLHGLDKQELRSEMRNARQKLLEARNQRVRPGRDDKILVSWNALAISALARAAVTLDEPVYGEAAARAVEFIFCELSDEDCRLLHFWRGGVADQSAFLDDYAFLAIACLDLYEWDYSAKSIDRAERLIQIVLEYFDDSGRGFFFSASDSEELIARTNSFQDSSLPSGNAMAALALLRLGRLTGKSEWVERSQAVVAGAASLLQRGPMAAAQMLIVANELLSESRQLVFVYEQQSDAEKMIALFRNLKRVGDQLLVVPNRKKDQGALAELLSGKELIEGQPTLYVCQKTECNEPIVSMDSITSSLAEQVNNTT